MAPSTTYNALVATLTFPQGQFLETKVYSLAPQTTPFTPPSDPACSTIPRALRCQSKPEDLTSGALCYADQFVQEKDASLPTQCFPKQYRDIWTPGDEFDDMPSLAYPGTACISDWTIACTTDVLGSAGTYKQEWCCPPGSWTCLTVGNGQTPYRDCVSHLSTPTEVWVNNIATTNGRETTYWSSWRKISLSNLPRNGPISVKHPPFPLYARVPNALTADESSGLSTGAIAGIVIGILAVVLLFVGSGIFVCLRKRRLKREAAASQTEITESEERAHKALGYDTKQELPGHGHETREMDMLSPDPVELSPQTRISEVEGSRPVELAS